MKGHFYSHIIELEPVYASIGELDLTPAEHDELITIMESSIHHAVVNAILAELSEEDKRIFLKHMITESHDKLWMHLREKMSDAEEKIRKAVEELKEELHADLEEVKKKDK